MNSIARRFIVGIIAAVCAATAASADIKITTKNTTAGHGFESTTYIKGARQRSDLAAGMVTIYQCDLKRMIQINNNAKTYMIMSTEAEPEVSSKTGPAQPPPAPAPEPQTKTRRGGIVTFIITATDTGERKKMFGFTARHIKTSMTKEASPDACDPKTMRIETDGWYIDLEYGLHCSTDRPVRPPIPAMRGATSRPECQDEIRYKHTGAARPGYPLEITTTIYGDDGKTFTTSVEVVDLSTSTLDASLFDVPEGYTEAKNYQELMGIPSIGSVIGRRRPAEAPTEPSTSAATGAKRPGAVRIGVVTFNNKTDRPVSLDTLRDHLIGQITGSNVDAVPINATSPADVEAEARQKECDYILYTDVADIKKPSTAGKIGGLLGRAGVGSLKDKYEARTDFRLFAVGSQSPQLASSSSAKGDGAEDAAVSAALDQEARSVVSEVRKKK